MPDNRPSVCFVTVCGTLVDQEFLLGAIREHAELGLHLVLDVSPPSQRRFFRNLPSSVEWVYEDGYLSGTNMFRFRSALVRANELAASKGCDVIANVDSDEFFVPQSMDKLFSIAKDPLTAVEHRIVTWGSDGKPHLTGTGMQFIRRVWSSRMPVSIPLNSSWPRHKNYNGNPERHPIAVWPKGVRLVRVMDLVHHHLHWAVHHKAHHPFSEFKVEGWHEWPPLIKRWEVEGIPPSREFL